MSRALLTLVLCLVTLAAPRASSVVAPAEFREVVRDATLIVRGLVTASQVVRDLVGEVSTVSTVAVSAVLKGTADTHVSVLVPGGRIGRYRSVMTGAPRLELNDAAVFFLKRGADGLWRPVGLAMGVYRLQTDRLGQTVIRPPLLTHRTASLGTVVRGDVRRPMLSVQEFDALVQIAIAPPTAVARPRPAAPVRGGAR